MITSFSFNMLRRAVIIAFVLARINLVMASSSTSRNPFTNDRTGVSGFGARSLKKSIFPLGNVTAEASMSKNSANNDDSTPSSLLDDANATLVTDAPKLWVQKSQDPSDALWFQVRDNGKTKTLKISVTKTSGNWHVEKRKQSNLPDSEWIPIEGLFGIYTVPSGILLVLVSKTEPVYSAPPLVINKGNHQKAPWWQIRRVENVELVHLGRPDMLLTHLHLKEEIRQLRLLRKSLKQHEFYYVPSDESSVVTDMTMKLQESLAENLQSEEAPKKQWWESKESRPDPRFFWNQAAAESILQRYEDPASNSLQRNLTGTLLQHVIPLTSAFVGVQSNLTVGDGTSTTYQQVLISRRSRFRAGTRFTRRGADASGAVANFVETEQICLTVDPKKETVKQVMSHVQTRGSIPLRWSSPADVKTYRPRIRIGTDPLAQARALRLHLLEQYAYYVAPSEEGRPGTTNSAEIIFVNLIDKHSDQGRLGRAFDAVLKAVMDVHANDTASESTDALQGSNTSSDIDSCFLGPKSVEHVWFDFHAEVKDGKWGRLIGLLNNLQPSLTDHGYFLAEAPTRKIGWSVQRRQNAVVRTNCMDCLDRTNVVQSIFGRYMLFDQLSTAKGDKKKAKTTWADHGLTFRKNQMSLPWSEGEVAHRSLWADNADAISRLYAGTAALKGDFTRTGKRTKKGALDDGMNSLQRYYLNNFLDSDRQEGMDLMVGYANFSNLGFLEEEDEELSLSQQEDEKTLLSIKEAARQTLLGGVLDGLNDKHRSDVQQRLGEIGIRRGGTVKGLKSHLDLRWVPGDLQSHLRSQAENLSRKRGRLINENSEFTSSKALEAIDRRAASDMPWWAEAADSTSSDDSKKDQSNKANFNKEESESEGDDLPLTQHQRQPTVTPAQLLVILVVGIKAPRGLAAAVVTLLGLVFFPEWIEPR